MTLRSAQANYLNSEGNVSYPISTIWPKIKIDLDFVSISWNNTGFDLWEEVDGSSFFTVAVQHRAMREGSAFAAKQGDSARASAYAAAANGLLCFLQVCNNPALIPESVAINIHTTLLL